MVRVHLSWKYTIVRTNRRDTTDMDNIDQSSSLSPMLTRDVDAHASGSSRSNVRKASPTFRASTTGELVGQHLQQLAFSLGILGAMSIRRDAGSIIIDLCVLPSALWMIKNTNKT